MSSETSPPKKDSDIDWPLLEYNLSLSPEQRIIEHQRALDLYFELQNAGKQLNAKPQPAT